jgi:nucleoside-triphosphatase
VTGSPGIGKTTVLMKVVEALNAKGYGVGGMISREVRPSGSRVGFEVTNLNSGSKGWLASVHQERGPQVGRYRVDIDSLNSIGVRAMLEACEKLDVIVVDEIGPMELFSEQFRIAVKKVVESEKLVVCAVHSGGRGEFLDSVKKREDCEIHVVTYGNRNHLHETIVRGALDFLAKVNAE